MREKEEGGNWQVIVNIEQKERKMFKIEITAFGVFA